MKQTRQRKNANGGAAAANKKRKAEEETLHQDTANSGVSRSTKKRNVSQQPLINAETNPVEMASQKSTARSRSKDGKPKQRVEEPRPPTPKQYSLAWLYKAAGRREKGADETELIVTLRMKKANDVKGWLRNIEHELDPQSTPPNFISTQATPRLHLTDKEREKAYKLLLLVKPHFEAIKLVAHAWGIGRKAMERWEKRAVGSQGMTIQRKKRCDAGKTLLNSEEKRRSVYTPKFIFAKLLRERNPGKSFRQEDIDKAWEVADESTKKECSDLRDKWLKEGPPISMSHEISKESHDAVSENQLEL
ncbi:hypothetical protein FisN_24Hh060 [Fistulifera solaris]|jgi:hypothetical protein|uniref:Uncharacterized protein n=1 Tax=Fistulifera solaris TaxID=1519565 RepID=A0A1Z5JEQ1_FISSO|nr:hypothetical protein FisN_24Hh060 [Fistulifera solaris]|eukprot:GAX12485.1 hypothetical protein FisN_24Hh060 [Fistulifera solaris]